MAGNGRVAAVADALVELHEGLPPTDGVKWFAWLYADVTRELVRLFDDGELEAPEFIGDLVVRFGDSFLASVADPALATRAWRPLFEHRHDAHVAPVQFAVGGLNAHLGSELPAGLAAELNARGIDPRSAGAEHRDWDRINQTIAAVEPKAKRYLLTEAAAEVDRVFDRAGDVVATWSVEAAREAAWIHGCALWQMWDDAVLRAPYLRALDRTTGLVSRLLLVPTG